MYSENVLNRFANPKNVGLLKNADATGTAGSSSLGDLVRVYLKIEHDRIIDAKFKAFGGVATISSADALIDLVKNKSIETAVKISVKDILDELGFLPEEKKQSVNVSREAFQQAIETYLKKDK